MIKKLKIKFIIINMSFVSIVMIIVFGSLFLSNQIKFHDDSKRFLESLINEPFHIDDKEKKMPRNHEDRQLYAFTTILNKEKNIVTLVNNIGKIDIEIAQKAVNGVDFKNSRLGTIEDLTLRYLVRRYGDGYIVAFMDISKDDEFLSQLVKYSLVIFIGSLTAFVIISVFLANYTIKPVEKAWEKQQQFVADASHELKTPLTVISATTSILLKDKQLLNEKQFKWINYIDSETIRMQKLVKDLLFLAKSDESKNNYLNTEVNVNDVLENCLLLLEPVAFELGLELSNIITGENKVMGNEDMLKRLIIILIDNAMKYSIENGEICVNLKSVSGKSILTVNNKGSIISDEGMKHIFDRFYKEDKSRNTSSCSYGLGLSIAKEIVETHNGKISVVSSYDKGTTFTVSLPSK